MNETHEIAVALSAAIRAHAPIPALEVDLDFDKAYRLQHQVTAERGTAAAGGVKLGVTDPRMQEYFGLDNPLLASLYADGRQSTGARIEHIEGRMIECELGLILDGAGRVTGVFPAIEVVHVKFERNEDLTAANLIATNLGADMFITGNRLSPEALANPVAMRLLRDGTVVNDTGISESLQEQQELARWVWAEAVGRGFTLADETLVMMGTKGKVVPCEPGNYVADYGDLGRVEFSVGE